MQPKRMHPLKIIVSFGKTLRNSFVVILFLFVVHFNDESTFIIVGQILFLAFLVYRLGSLALDWWKTTYILQHESIHIYRGVLQRKENRVPFDQVQNVQWNTPFYYRFLNLTALSLQTSAVNKEASVMFEAVKQSEARRIEQLVLDKRKTGTLSESTQEELEEETDAEMTEMARDPEEKNQANEEKVHFRPTRRDLWKASFLSFSFLAFIPVPVVIYAKLDDIVNLEKHAKGFLAFLTSSWLLMGIVILLLVVLAVTFGIVRTFLKYGKHEIASDKERIYIRTGTINRQSFAVGRTNVQAIQIQQGPLKKLLGLLEINLISAGGGDEETEEVHSLYPFLPQDHSFGLLDELLPEFKWDPNMPMEKLPKKAIYARLLRIPWFWIIVTVLILWFKAEWWFLSPFLFVLTYVGRFFDYRNTRFLLNGAFIQFKSGGLWSTLFITQRKKIMEAEVDQSLLQKWLDLATIKTFNRTKPVHEEELKDVPFEASNAFIHWYQDRYQEIEVYK